MMTIYYAGNPLVPFDSMAAKLAEALAKELKAEACEFEPTENLPEATLTIVDCAEGIKQVTLITDLSKLATKQACSLHDFDLAWNLKLMQKAGILKSVRIYAVPIGMGFETALEQLRELFNSNEP